MIIVKLRIVVFSFTGTNTVEHVVHEELSQRVDAGNYLSTENNSEQDKLHFHHNFGPLVKLSNNQRTAERRRPLEEFNNSIVLTHRPLRDDELFQVSITRGRNCLVLFLNE